MLRIDNSIDTVSSSTPDFCIIPSDLRTNAFVDLAQSGDSKAVEAVEKLIAQNLGALHSVIRNQKYRSLGAPDEILSLAVIAFMGAIDEFDPSKGVKFITFATLLMHRYLQKEVMIHLQRDYLISRRLSKELREIDSTTSELISELGCKPSTREVATRLNINEDRLNKILSSVPQIISVDRNNDDQNSDPDISYGVIYPSIEQDIQALELNEYIQQAISTLNIRQKYVLRAYYGFDNGGEKRTYKQIASELGLSESRVLQNVKEALKIIRVYLADSYIIDPDMMLFDGIDPNEQQRISNALKHAFLKAFKQPRKYEFFDTPLFGTSDLQRSRLASIQWLGTLLGVSRSSTLSDGLSICSEALGVSKQFLSNIVVGSNHIPVSKFCFGIAKLFSYSPLTNSTCLPDLIRALVPLLDPIIVESDRIALVSKSATHQIILNRFCKTSERLNVKLEQQKLLLSLNLSKQEWDDVCSQKRELTSQQANFLNALTAAMEAEAESDLLSSD